MGANRIKGRRAVQQSRGALQTGLDSLDQHMPVDHICLSALWSRIHRAYCRTESQSVTAEDREVAYCEFNSKRRSAVDRNVLAALPSTQTSRETKTVPQRTRNGVLGACPRPWNTAHPAAQHPVALVFGRTRNQSLLVSAFRLASLCNLCVLCVSVVCFCSEFINHRDTENTEVAQRSAKLKRNLSGVPQTGGDSVDSGGKGVVQIVVVFTAPFSTQQFNLNQTQRIDVRIAQANRTSQHWVLLKQRCLFSQTQHHLFSALELFEEHAEYLLPQHRIRNQAGIETRNCQIGFRQSHLNVCDHFAEERKLMY